MPGEVHHGKEAINIQIYVPGTFAQSYRKRNSLMAVAPRARTPLKRLVDPPSTIHVV